MLRFQSGDAAGFEFLFQKHLPSVLNFCLRYQVDRAVAEDLAQETFLRLYGARRTYRPLAKFTTFLFQIAANLALNERRDMHRRGARSLDETAGGPEWLAGHKGPPLRDVLPDPSAMRPAPMAEAAEQARHVRKAVAALPDRQRAALLLVEYERMSYADVAGALETTVPAVETLLFRARQALRSHLAHRLS